MIKKTIIIISLLLLVILFYISFKIYIDWKQNFIGKIGIGEGKPTIYSIFRNAIPTEIKTFIKNTILSKSITNEKIKRLENQIELLIKENEELWISSSLIKSKHFTLNLEKKILPFISRNEHGKSSNYIDFHKKNLVLVTGVGTTYFITMNNLINDGEKNYQEIENNLNKVITSDHFWSIDKSSKYSEEMSVKDTLIHNNIIYVSYSREVTEECFNTSIVKANFNYNFLNFKNYFTYQDCHSGKGKKTVFGRGGGGRIYPYKDNKLLFTIGDTGSLRAQEDDFLLGKIIEIETTSAKHKIISKGHRNQQGLLYLVEKDIILSSEHGSKGGGELNLIKRDKNYGWPISSYGKGPQLYQNHSMHGFEEPLHYFIPSVAPSEIILVPKKFSTKWQNNIILTTLSGTFGYGKSIYRFEMNKDFNMIQNIEQIKIGDRIRDIKYNDTNNLFVLVLENSNSIGLLYK